MNTQKANSKDDALTTGTIDSDGLTSSYTVQNFKFDLINIRTIERDGEVWFVALDVCAALAKPNKRNVDRVRINSGESKKCPYCAELIKKQANTCRYCHKDLTI